MRLSVALSVLMVSSAAYAAASLTGNSLQQFCAAPSGSVGDAACNHFIEGFTAGADFSTDDKAICIPKGATVSQGRLVVEKFMRENPERLHLQAALIVGAALRAIGLPSGWFDLSQSY